MNENQIIQENNNEIEVWKSVQNYEGLYEISNLGRVRSLDRFVAAKCNSIAFKKGKILKPGIDYKGYQRVFLYKNGKGKNFRNHRLVALAFISNPNNLPCINHKNNNKLQNIIENLEWITNSDNLKHAWKNGFKNNNYLNGEKSPHAKIKEELVIKIKKDYIPHKFGRKKLSQKYGIKEGCICSIIYGKTWKHIII